MDTHSYWSDTVALPEFRPVDGNFRVDVVVIGAGITGITAAALLKKAGLTVALVDRGRCGGFDTLNTTAHLTAVTDMRLYQLVSHFGRDAARRVWTGGRQAIDHIYANVQREGIKCEFAWVPGYLHGETRATLTDVKNLKKDAARANAFGFPARFMDNVPLVNRPGVEFQHQAKFHPGKYVSALLRTIPGKGSQVFGRSEVQAVRAKPLSVRFASGKIQCGYVVLATHTPLTGKAAPLAAAWFQTKLFLCTTYALGGRLPAGLAPEASFWDTGNPYHHLRIDRRRGFDYAIYGGEDHKTGQINRNLDAYEKLERAFRSLCPTVEVDHRWSGQVIETPDGLPYIGETASRQFVATGFSGNGMTFGTLGAIMAADAILKRPNPWQQLFDVHRKPFHGGAAKHLRENADYPFYLLRDWLAGRGKGDIKSVGRDQGRVLSVHGRDVAVYRDPKGRLAFCLPVCTHLKCIVGWNDAEKTWDCPCHGSRFSPTGEVLAGPAEQPLEKIEFESHES